MNDGRGSLCLAKVSTLALHGADFAPSDTLVIGVSLPQLYKNAGLETATKVIAILP